MTLRNQRNQRIADMQAAKQVVTLLNLVALLLGQIFYIIGVLEGK